MPLPSITGLAVAVGPARAPAPARDLAAVGRRVPFAAEVTGRPVAGTAVTPLAGAAPAVTSDGRLAVLLVGELYNRDRLGAALGGGAAGTDAELLLECCHAYGVNALRLLNGRFAAVVAGPDRTVVAADHAASVPLYVSVGPDGAVRAATEAKALAGGAAGEPSLPGADPVAGMAGVHRVRAGHALVVGHGEAPLRAVRTWSPTYSRAIVDPGEAVQAVAARLAGAVRARSRADEVTVVLSGGIDSSAVAALSAGPGTRTVSLGTDAGDEFDAARAVASHLGTSHEELKMPAADLVGELPWAAAAAEIADPVILEYLLPLVALYRRLPGPPRRILTGYGADIPLGGMHRTTEPLELLDDMIAGDMDTFDGLNELSPLLSGIAGHWTTHPYWDRDVLDLLVALEPGLKRRHGRDKWVLREAMRGRLPEATLARPKLGIHEGSGLTSAWTQLLVDAGVPARAVADAKQAIATRLYREAVVEGAHPAELTMDALLAGARP